jgi:hypothetical protein
MFKVVVVFPEIVTGLVVQVAVVADGSQVTLIEMLPVYVAFDGTGNRVTV